MNIDYTVWASIALMHFVAVASPGPDFAIVLKQSLQKGLRPALWTSIGIGAGILLHVLYSILGISLVIKTTPWLYQFLLYVAAAYFIWIGVSALRSKPSSVQTMHTQDSTKSKWYKAFGLGFLTNGLNPKATLFFLALFTAAIPAETSLSTKVFYGGYLATATAIWFCFLSYLTNFKHIRLAYQSHGHWFDRLMGVVLIIMAIVLLWA
jgi:threonine/homoserine/homoserine lactone efflux protein